MVAKSWLGRALRGCHKIAAGQVLQANQGDRHAFGISCLHRQGQCHRSCCRGDHRRRLRHDRHLAHRADHHADHRGDLRQYRLFGSLYRAFGRGGAGHPACRGARGRGQCDRTWRLCLERDQFPHPCLHHLPDGALCEPAHRATCQARGAGRARRAERDRPAHRDQGCAEEVRRPSFACAHPGARPRCSSLRCAAGRLRAGGRPCGRCATEACHRIPRSSSTSHSGMDRYISPRRSRPAMAINGCVQ